MGESKLKAFMTKIGKAIRNAVRIAIEKIGNLKKWILSHFNKKKSEPQEEMKPYVSAKKETSSSSSSSKFPGDVFGMNMKLKVATDYLTVSNGQTLVHIKYLVSSADSMSTQELLKESDKVRDKLKDISGFNETIDWLAKHIDMSIDGLIKVGDKDTIREFIKNLDRAKATLSDFINKFDEIGNQLNNMDVSNLKGEAQFPDGTKRAISAIAAQVNRAVSYNKDMLTTINKIYTASVKALHETSVAESLMEEDEEFAMECAIYA